MRIEMEKIDKFDGEFAFLSNFHPCIIFFDGQEYPSVEHAYQAAKTFYNPHREKIRLAPTAAAAKKIGRSITIRQDWYEVRLSIMREFCNQKFKYPGFRQLLVMTGDVDLIEGNWWGDTFWGVCDGVGSNHLGKILMTIRNIVREEGLVGGR